MLLRNLLQLFLGLVTSINGGLDGGAPVAYQRYAEAVAAA